MGVFTTVTKTSARAAKQAEKAKSLNKLAESLGQKEVSKIEQGEVVRPQMKF